MAPFWTSKYSRDRLTEGGTTSIPSRIASRRKSASLSVFDMSSVMVAARNSTGWFAFIQAV